MFQGASNTWLGNLEEADVPGRLSCMGFVQACLLSQLQMDAIVPCSCWVGREKDFSHRIENLTASQLW